MPEPFWIWIAGQEAGRPSCHLNAEDWFLKPWIPRTWSIQKSEGSTFKVKTSIGLRGAGLYCGMVMVNFIDAEALASQPQATSEKMQNHWSNPIENHYELSS